jgi:hypothetical protein
MNNPLLTVATAQVSDPSQCCEGTAQSRSWYFKTHFF